VARWESKTLDMYELSKKLVGKGRTFSLNNLLTVRDRERERERENAIGRER